MGKKSKPETPERRLELLVKEVRDEYARWDMYHDRGGSDPTWPDGVNMELIRNHIIYGKRQMKELCDESGLDLPDLYHRPLPPEVPRDYMARKEEIREHAIKSLSAYEADPDYKYLLKIAPRLDKKAQEKTYIVAVLNYPQGLRRALRDGDLVTMRRHERAESYIPSFRSCAERVRAFLAEREAEELQEDVQLSLF